jgi:hypothetical protein
MNDFRITFQSSELIQVMISLHEHNEFIQM